ncbi:hypothetical protein EB105725_17_00090 [Shimwellia blattae DSM 4481 = NBRC 105725]|nr:hypothetical protein EB105725_17_00090 [Shimwellia blattae DSM 4481 = NBRC 105725]
MAGVWRRITGKWNTTRIVAAKGKTGFVDSETWNVWPVTGGESIKKAANHLPPFLFACFLLDSAAILY